MKILVETPKYSFKKYRKKRRGYAVDLVSPIPTPFNYGIILNTKADDGLPQDAIILGEKQPQGRELEAEKLGVACFTDEGIQDNKIIVSTKKRVDWQDKIKINLFFHVYSLYKKIVGLTTKGRIPDTRFEGIIFEGA
ncbi:MAG: inorganic pyrophosphatase [Candidatus Altiarchaeales archaeon]|nr:inorganic pyrophosphatase [Candidatus Altiarchaeales archaeon]